MDETPSYKSVEIHGIEMLYLEAGTPDTPAILLLHGPLSASHMFRELMPLLSSDHHLIAPDMTGFSFAQTIRGIDFPHSFAHLARIINEFIDRMGLSRFVLYVCDFSASIGLRVAITRPELILAIISQGGNVYAEGMSSALATLQAYWLEPDNPVRREALRPWLEHDQIEKHNREQTSDTANVGDDMTLDKIHLARQGAADVYLDLLLDEASNVALYEAFHAYFRCRQPPLLAIWGLQDPYTLPQGAMAFRQDLPDAQLCFLDSGHFILETHCQEVADAVREFLKDWRN